MEDNSSSFTLSFSHSTYGLVNCANRINKPRCFISQTLYKTQAQELKEEVEERSRNILELEEERADLTHRIQVAVARADSEALARTIAEETVGELEKEKTMKVRIVLPTLAS